MPFEKTVEDWKMCNFKSGLRSRSQSRKGSDGFGWIRCRIFYRIPEVQLNHVLHHTPKLGILTRACRNRTICLKLLLKHTILSVYHDFHCMLVAAKLLTAKLHSCYAKESEYRESRVGRRCRKFWKGRS